MLYQGLDIPLLKLDTIIEYGVTQVPAGDKYGAIDDNGKEEDKRHYEAASLGSVEDVDSETTDDGKPYAKPKVVVRKDSTWDEYLYCWRWLINVFLFRQDGD